MHLFGHDRVRPVGNPHSRSLLKPLRRRRPSLGSPGRGDMAASPRHRMGEGLGERASGAWRGVRNESSLEKSRQHGERTHPRTCNSKRNCRAQAPCIDPLPVLVEVLQNCGHDKLIPASSGPTCTRSWKAARQLSSVCWRAATFARIDHSYGHVLWSASGRKASRFCGRHRAGEVGE